MDTFVESLLLANSPLFIVRPHASQNQLCAEAISISQQYFSSLRHVRFDTQQIYASTKMHKVILSKRNQVYRRCLTAVFVIEADHNSWDYTVAILAQGLKAQASLASSTLRSGSLV